MKAAIVGGGVIGGGWAARFLLNGWDVAVYDPDPSAPKVIEGVLDRARMSLKGLLDVTLPVEGTLTFVDDPSAAASGADWIQESVPERLEIKAAVYQQLKDAPGILASSTSGFKPSQLDPEGRVIVAHPFNPVYLLPLVELVGTETTCARAGDILRDIGMHPLFIRKEIDAHVADRLLEAVWREALWLVKDGIATTAEIDDAIRMGFGLRWAQMGLFETYRCAGGPDGMRHFLAQFGPALKWPWTKLMDVPEFDEDLIDLIAGQSDAQSGHLSIPELLSLRDRNLVAILRALKAQGSGVGSILNQQEDALRGDVDIDIRAPEPISTYRRVVPLDWVDYNGHMNEAKYLQAFGDATDRFMHLLGCDAEYIAAGSSYFTAETHIRHVDEAHAGTEIDVRTQLILGKGKKLHIFHAMYAGETLLATGEHFLLHVSLETRRPSEPSSEIAQRLAWITEAHAGLPMPEGIGRHVGQRPA